MRLIKTLKASVLLLTQVSALRICFAVDSLISL